MVSVYTPAHTLGKPKCNRNPGYHSSSILYQSGAWHEVKENNRDTALRYRCNEAEHALEPSAHDATRKPKMSRLSGQRPCWVSHNQQPLTKTRLKNTKRMMKPN